MKTIALTLLAIPMAVFSLSCNRDGNTKPTEGSGNGTIAVVDLDKVASAMGWTDEMKKNLQQTEASVADQLRAALKPSQTALEDKRNEITKADNLNTTQITQLNNAKSKQDLEQIGLNSKQIDELVQAFANAYQISVQAQNTLQQQVQNQRNQIIKKYREAVAPSVRRVAIAEHKSVVLTPDASVMYYETAADLSDKVIDDLQHSNSGKVELPAIPVLKIELPPAPSATTRPK